MTENKAMTLDQLHAEICKLITWVASDGSVSGVAQREVYRLLKAHLSQPAQAVDVGAIREVLNEMSRLPYDSANTARIGKLSRALSTAQAEGWLPIATAPKDELILVGPTKRMGICAAMNHSRDGWVTETPGEWAGIYTPTHWMPLPATPAPDKEGKA